MPSPPRSLPTISRVAVAAQARGRRLRAFACIAAVSLGGCGVNRIVPTTDMSADGAARHPIVLAETKYEIDVFPTGSARGQIDAYTAGQIRDFAQRYRTVGRGEMTILVPQGGPAGAQAQYLAPSLQIALERELARPVLVASYPVADPSLAAPVRLMFQGLRAKVAHRCGDWPSDLASGSSLRGWENKPYWNFGCSQQSMIAAQVDDPRDLAGPRGEQPTDTQFRTRAISNVRGGKDPGTSWKTSNTSIGSVGGGSQ